MMTFDEQGYVTCKKLGPVGKSKHKYQIQLPDEAHTIIQLGAKGFNTTKATTAPAPEDDQEVEALNPEDYEEEAGDDEEIWKNSRVRLQEDDWERVPEITEDGRPQHLGEYAGHSNYRNDSNSPLIHFLQWFPIGIMYAQLEGWNLAMRTKFPNCKFQLDRGSLLQFLGMLIRMSIYGLPVVSYF